MRDLTPYLMGDPGTSYRRSPTPEEMSRPNSIMEHIGYKYSPLRTLEVGGTIYTTERKKAERLYQRFLQNGMRGTVKKLQPGRWAVTRVE